MSTSNLEQLSDDDLIQEAYRDLAFVVDYMKLLKNRGVYEKALLYAYTTAKCNYANWGTGALDLLFRIADRKKLRSLSGPIPEADTLKLYRGVAGIGAKRRVRGTSWTASLDAAAWFATRLHLASPAVFTCCIKPSTVYCSIVEKNEDEFIIMPPQRAVRLKMTDEELKECAGRHSQRIHEGDIKILEDLKREG